MRNRIVLRSVVVAAVGVLCIPAVAYAQIRNTAGSSANSGAAAVEQAATQLKNLDYNNAKEKFTGKVTSALVIQAEDVDVMNECVEDRTVELWRKYKKKTKSGVKRRNVLIGETTTNESGAFAIKAEKKSGKYRAEVPAHDFAFWAYYGADGVLDNPLNMEVNCGAAVGEF
jgi:hypothetical protein